MPLSFSNSAIHSAIQTLESVSETISQLIDWNKGIETSEFYFGSQHGMQLLAANCTLITAIGEGVNRVNRVLPGFLDQSFSDIPWHAVVGMRNHIAHGYFELDADLVYEAVMVDIPPLGSVVREAIVLLRNMAL